MPLTKATYSMIDGAVLNVLDYGADPTGANDSTAAIQAAIDEALAANKAVYIPTGTYLNTGLMISTDQRPSLHIFGDSAGDYQPGTTGSILKHSGTGYSLTIETPTPSTHVPFPCRVEGLTFYGNNTCDGGINIIGKSSVCVEHCTFTYYTKSAASGISYSVNGVFQGVQKVSNCYLPTDK